jgi:hypothetical protein
MAERTGAANGEDQTEANPISPKGRFINKKPPSMDAALDRREGGIKRKEVNVDKKRDMTKDTVTPPRKDNRRGEGIANGAAIINKGAYQTLKASAPARAKDEKGGGMRREGGRPGQSSPQAGPMHSSQGDASPARVVGKVLNGLRGTSRKRTDSLPDNISSRDNRNSSGEEDDGSLPRKPTLSFKLTVSQNDYDPLTSPREAVSPRPTALRDEESESNSPPRSRKRDDAESLRNALTKEVQSGNNLRDKLLITQKKFDFLERNREELAQLLHQLRQELETSSPLSSPTQAGPSSGRVEVEVKKEGESGEGRATAGTDGEDDVHEGDCDGGEREEKTRTSSSSSADEDRAPSDGAAKQAGGDASDRAGGEDDGERAEAASVQQDDKKWGSTPDRTVTRLTSQLI